MPNEQFQRDTKFGLIMCNETYDPEYVIHGNLPEVVNDFRNAKQTAKMLDIPAENTIELLDASHGQLTKEWNSLKDKVLALARPMSGKTGILGTFPDGFAGGFEWDNIKKDVMKLKGSFDHIEVDLDANDQQTIK